MVDLGFGKFRFKTIPSKKYSPSTNRLFANGLR